VRQPEEEEGARNVFEEISLFWAVLAGGQKHFREAAGSNKEYLKFVDATNLTSATSST